jgi:hypothetical protein
VIQGTEMLELADSFITFTNTPSLSTSNADGSFSFTLYTICLALMSSPPEEKKQVEPAYPNLPLLAGLAGAGLSRNTHHVSRGM